MGQLEQIHKIIVAVSYNIWSHNFIKMIFQIKSLYEVEVISTWMILRNKLDVQKFKYSEVMRQGIN